jgi:hypothetical protein
MIQIQPSADKKVAPPDFEVTSMASRQTFRVAHGKERAAAAQKPLQFGSTSRTHGSWESTKPVGSKIKYPA